jgi:hypothetical protein
MAGKSETMNLVDHQKLNKWRENSSTRVSNNGSKMNSRKIRNNMDQLKQKKAENSTTRASRGKMARKSKPPALAKAKKWRKQRV